MPSLLQKTVLFLALPLTGILLYLLLRSDEEEDDGPVVTTKQVAIKMRVPRAASGAIIGQQGCRIKKIQEITKTRVNFEDEAAGTDDGTERTIIIRGTPQNAQLAELEICKIVAELPAVEQVDIFIPCSATGRVIGKGGETIRYLSRVCKARISVDRDDSRRKEGLTKVNIKGTAEAIANAKGMIEEKVQEEMDMQAKKSVINANRQQRGSSKQNSPRRDMSKDEVDRNDAQAVNGTNGTAAASASVSPVRLRHDDYMQVYVSAVEHPGHFWLQVLTEKANLLDEIGKEMTKYYGKEKQGQIVNYESLQVNDLVAAPFEHDEQWYRAKVLEKKEDNADLYYVDYGDNGLIHKSRLKKLRGDYLCLPFQALECSLAKVKPIGEEWGDEAVNYFEELTYTGQWRPLMAKCVTYKNEAEGQSSPSVQLFDTSGTQDVDIAKELIKKNLAIIEEDDDSIKNPAARLSPEKSSVSQMSPKKSPSLFASIKHGTD